VKIAPDGSRFEWGSYLGGSGDDGGTPSVRVNTAGTIVYYLMHTQSDDLATSTGAVQPARGGGVDLFLARFSADGSSLVASTYFGGNQVDFSETHGLAIDAADNAVLGLSTRSTDLATTAGAFQPAYAGGGGSGTGGGTNYPGDGYVAVLSPDFTMILGATYLGGRVGEGIEGVGTDAAGNVYVGGSSFSDDYPVSDDARQPTLSGGADMFVSVVSRDATTLVYSSYVGGGADDFARCLTHRDGTTALVGESWSTDFPTTAGATMEMRARMKDGALAVLR
jgi:hypothetical protein